MRYFLFIALLLFPALTASAKPCSSDSPVNFNCRAALSRLSPTQGAVGMWEVDRIQGKLTKMAEDPSALKKYLKGKRIEVVIGPGGKFYVIDGHHHAMALERLGFSPAYVRVVENFSHLSEQSFWREMKDRHYLRLTGKNGVPITVAELPKSIAGLKDDPYRSLAGIMSKTKGISRSKRPYVEFIWADYLRERIPPTMVREDWDGAVKEAIQLGFKPEAEDLPGFRELKKKKLRKKVAKRCWQQFQDLARWVDLR